MLKYEINYVEHLRWNCVGCIKAHSCFVVFFNNRILYMILIYIFLRRRSFFQAQDCDNICFHLDESYIVSNVVMLLNNLWNVSIRCIVLYIPTRNKLTFVYFAQQNFNQLSCLSLSYSSPYCKSQIMYVSVKYHDFIQGWQTIVWV